VGNAYYAVEAGYGFRYTTAATTYIEVTRLCQQPIIGLQIMRFTGALILV